MRHRISINRWNGTNENGTNTTCYDQFNITYPLFPRNAANVHSQHRMFLSIRRVDG